MSPQKLKSTPPIRLAVATLSLAIACTSGAEVLEEATLGDFPGSGGAFRDLGTLDDSTTTIEGSVSFDSDIYDTMVFRTANTTRQITVKLTSGAGGDFAINLGTGSSPELVNEGGCPDIFKNPRIVPPREYPLLSEPLPPGTYYLGLRTAIFDGITWRAVHFWQQCHLRFVGAGRGQDGLRQNHRQGKIHLERSRRDSGDANFGGLASDATFSSTTDRRSRLRGDLIRAGKANLTPVKT